MDMKDNNVAVIDNAKMLADMLLRTPDARVEFWKRNDWYTGDVHYDNMNCGVAMVKAITTIDSGDPAHLETVVRLHLVEVKPNSKDENGDD